VEQWKKHLSHLLRTVGVESVPNPIQSDDLKTKDAILRRRAAQARVTLPTDVALYIAQNFRSNERALKSALTRLLAYSSLNDTEITLTYAQQVLKRFTVSQLREVPTDSLQKMRPEQFGASDAIVRRQHWTTGGS
jgi:chromosomal replication initiator protein